MSKLRWCNFWFLHNYKLLFSLSQVEKIKFIAEGQIVVFWFDIDLQQICETVTILYSFEYQTKIKQVLPSELANSVIYNCRFICNI